MRRANIASVIIKSYLRSQTDSYTILRNSKTFLLNNSKKRPKRFLTEHLLI